MRALSFGTAAFLLASGVGLSAASAADLWLPDFGKDRRGSFDGTRISLDGGVGYRTGEASELVYDPVSGARISKLTWKHDTLVLRGTLGLDAGRFGLRASGWTQIADDTLMKDKDWLSYRSDWTHYSRHDETETDHARGFDAQLRYAAYQDGPVTVGPLVGWRYSNMAWTARGGDYIYSAEGYRDAAGSFVDGEKGITYEQWMSTPYLGASVDYRDDRWELAATFVGSVLVDYEDEDHHWMRDLRFVEKFDNGAFLGARLDGAYRVTEHLSVGGSVEYENYFETKGGTEIYSIETGAPILSIDGDAAGAAYEALTVGLFARVSL